MDKEKTISTAAEPEAKKEAVAAPVKAEKKSAAAPAKAEKKPAAKTRATGKAKAETLKPTVVVQFQGSEVDLDALVEAAKADFRQGKKRTSITDLKLYVKPEEHTAYYVINEKHNGSVAF